MLPTFLFLVLDTLVQLVDRSNLCQLARVPRRQSVSEGSYETAWYLRFSLCRDVSALPMMGGLVAGGTFTLTPRRSLSQYWANHQRGETGPASPLCSPLQLVSKLKYIYQVSFCLSGETLEKKFKSSIFFIEVLYHICCKQKHCVLPH